MARDDLDDFLEPKRRINLRPESKPLPAPSPGGKRPYKAFDPVDRRQITVWFRPRLRAWEALPYIRIDRIVTDATFGTRVAVICGFAVVVMKGRNLQELATALAQHRVESVDEFDPARFEQPTNDQAAYVENIEIHVESSEDMLAAAEEAAGTTRQ